jgi:hypothetical protein
MIKLDVSRLKQIHLRLGKMKSGIGLQPGSLTGLGLAKRYPVHSFVNPKNAGTHSSCRRPWLVPIATTVGKLTTNFTWKTVFGIFSVLMILINRTIDAF